MPSLTRDGRVLFAARALRTFAFGWLSVVLTLFLTSAGLSLATVGAVFTASMVEDVLLTVLLSALAARAGPQRLMVATAPLIALGGATLALAHEPLWLVAGAVLGTLSPNGIEAGAFSPLEQALLPETVPARERTRAFAWYNVCGFLPAALGSLAAGCFLYLAKAGGLDDLSAYRAMSWVYAACGLLLALTYTRLGIGAPLAPGPPAPGARPHRLGLGRSRGIVLQLSALQGLDSLAGGFVIQSLMAYWFHARFGVPGEWIGALFFGTSFLSALSFLAAARVAERVGLLNTMVFTHLPSNVLLLLVPFMPSFELAAGLLLARHLLSQMDVPTRQAYAMALVDPAERPAAAGFTSSARALGQAVAPAFSGAAMSVAASGLPLILAGALKIVYDLALYLRFRGVALRAEGT